jgi:hypothetical protein
MQRSSFSKNTKIFSIATLRQMTSEDFKEAMKAHQEICKLCEKYNTYDFVSLYPLTIYKNPQLDFDGGDTLLICLAADMTASNIAQRQEKMLFLIEKGISDPRIEGKKSDSLIKVIFYNYNITIDQKVTLVKAMFDRMYAVPYEERKRFFSETLRQLRKFNHYVGYESNINGIANFCYPKPSFKNLDTMDEREILFRNTLRLYFNNAPKNFDEYAGYFKDLIICGYYSSLERLYDSKMDRLTPGRSELIKLIYLFSVENSSVPESVNEDVFQKDIKMKPLISKMYQ